VAGRRAGFRAAMVVAPGGGHTQLVTDKEGWEFAGRLNWQGIAAFVLKYRPSKVPRSTYTLPGAVYADTTGSVRLVRSRAAGWNLDPKRIGFSGFSAGGEIIGMMETRFDPGRPDSPDPVEPISSRPDFTVSIYPAYRPGANRPDAPPLFPVPKDASAAFLVCADDDRSHVEATVKFYLELEASHIPAEMHIYDYGGRRFGVRPTKQPPPVMGWTDRLKEWLAE
jgi:hypothetical protein